MIELTAPAAMRAWSRARRAEGCRVALVPTMGYLHEGHLRLVDHGRRSADLVVVSLFVNPTQFGPAEDLGRYPKDLERDRGLTRARGVDCLFVPSAEAIYPRPPAVRLLPGDLAKHLCGPRRPGHFEGVLTVVAKLLHLVEPEVAVFGRKDVQQATIIRRMAADLDFAVEILVAPTVREGDGLALSSRNVYLDTTDRRRAPLLSRALEEAHRAFRAGTTRATTLLERALGVLGSEPRIVVEYVEAVDPETLAPVEFAREETIVALAARLGATRLIDNIVLGDGLGRDDVLSA